MKKYKIVRTNGVDNVDVMTGLTWREAKIHIDHHAFMKWENGEVWYLKIIEDEDIDSYEVVMEYNEEERKNE